MKNHISKIGKWHILIAVTMCFFAMNCVNADPVVTGHATDDKIFISVKNNGDKDIVIEEYKKLATSVIFELWVDGRAVQLFPKDEAIVRRKRPFAPADRVTIKKGDEKKYTYDINTLMPSDSKNDKFSESMKNKIKDSKHKWIRVHIGREEPDGGFEFFNSLLKFEDK